jgi:hypothetical protein
MHTAQGDVAASVARCRPASISELATHGISNAAVAVDNDLAQDE